jgi:hypothetical protein
MPSGGGGGSSTQQTEPWGGAKPFLKDIFSESAGLYENNPMTPFGGLSVEDRLAQASQALGASPQDIASAFGLNPETLQQSIVSQVAAPTEQQLAAQQQAQALAGQGIGPLFGQATDVVSGALTGGGMQGDAAGYYQDVLGGQTTAGGLLESTAQGDFLNANPYLDQMYEAASRPVMEQFRAEVLPGINSSFASVGRSGSPAHQFSVGDRAVGALGRSLTDMASNIYGSNYDRERLLQQNAAGQLAGIQGGAASGLTGLGGMQTQTALSAPQLYQQQRAAELGNIGLLEGVGAQDQALAAQLAGQTAQTYGTINQEPWQRLGMYSDLVTGNPASRLMSQSTPYYSNPMAGALGGGLGGAATGAMIGGPYGAAIGGGLGLLGGYFM